MTPRRGSYTPRSHSIMDSEAAESVLDFAEQAAKQVKAQGGKAILEQVEQQYVELQAAMQWFIDQQRSSEALRLANALYSFWIMKQRFDDGSVWFDRVLGLPGADDSIRGSCFIGAGFMACWKGEDARAAALYNAGLDIGRQLGDAVTTARALGGLCRVAVRTDVAEARRLAREELIVSEEAANDSGRSDAMHLLG